MNGAQFRAITIKNAGITASDTEGTTLATIASICVELSFQKTAADAMANTATAEFLLGKMPGVAYRLISAEYVPAAALTGDATNNAVFTLRRHPAAGGAGVTIATLTTTASMVQWVATALTNSNVLGVASDSITLEISKGGSGVAVPAGVLRCVFALSGDVTSLTQAA